MVVLGDNEHCDEATLIAWCREGLAHFKAPRGVVVAEAPKTATGKLQRFNVRALLADPDATITGDLTASRSTS